LKGGLPDFHGEVAAARAETLKENIDLGQQAADADRERLGALLVEVYGTEPGENGKRVRNVGLVENRAGRGSSGAGGE
jgi:hypothetical protein